MSPTIGYFCLVFRLPSFLLVGIIVAGGITWQRAETETEFACPSGLFACPFPSKSARNLMCIPSNYRCNGRVDCGDASDESNCPNITCPPYDSRDRDPWMACTNGIVCIRRSQICDGTNDCGDWSDEQRCPQWCLPDIEFRCYDSTTAFCIRQKYVCDGHNDCGNNLDEQNCTTSCDDGLFKCVTIPACIASYLVCNGNADCDDWSDEKNCAGSDPSGVKLFKSRLFKSDGRRAAQHLQHDTVVAVVVTIVASVVIVVIVIATLFGKRYRRRSEVTPAKPAAAATVVRRTAETQV